MRFFITGLPRSRTAWFANYMSYGNTACFHDKFRDVGSPEGLYALMESTEAECVGHADPANLLVAEELIGLYPNARWLVIRRDAAQCFRSFSLYVPELRSSNLLALSSALDRFIRQWEPMVLDFNSIMPAAVERAATFLNPEWSCPQWRRDMLCNMQVQLEPNFMKREIKRLKGERWALC